MRSLDGHFRQRPPVAAGADQPGNTLPAGAAFDPIGVDTTVPNPARRYDFLLGGKDNFAADRASADELLRRFPHVRTAAQENRRFLIRAVRYLAHAGVRQFLDIGTGYPTAPNVHEAAQAITPDARVLYVDNDPVVVAHTRALLTSPTPGAVDYLHADLRNPDAILRSPQARTVLDFAQPIGLLLVAVLHFIDDTDQPYEARQHPYRRASARQLRRAVPRHVRPAARRHDQPPQGTRTTRRRPRPLPRPHPPPGRAVPDRSGPRRTGPGVHR